MARNTPYAEWFTSLDWHRVSRPAPLSLRRFPPVLDKPISARCRSIPSPDRESAATISGSDAPAAREPWAALPLLPPQGWPRRL